MFGWLRGARIPTRGSSTSSGRSDRIKLLYWDGSGLVLYAKRLEQGGFRWPQIIDGVMRLTAVQLQALVAGREWTRVMSPRRTRTPRGGILIAAAR
ncbi:IS66 family insertion sequence element accessory protein TnpB [Phenylobacterium immobile]|uniref:IS66 family insertion sequence element accessory protein TnpB n=1 Tax=Phenylobacterium immobile TaxID=21 RepID=UPI000AFF3B7A|nr:IS66 family insertion sequence element accessory protein TnpB [Phenylobacterium immobile]